MIRIGHGYYPGILDSRTPKLSRSEKVLFPVLAVPVFIVMVGMLLVAKFAPVSRYRDS